MGNEHSCLGGNSKSFEVTSNIDTFNNACNQISVSSKDFQSIEDLKKDQCDHVVTKNNWHQSHGNHDFKDWTVNKQHYLRQNPLYLSDSGSAKESNYKNIQNEENDPISENENELQLFIHNFESTSRSFLRRMNIFKDRKAHNQKKTPFQNRYRYKAQKSGRIAYALQVNKENGKEICDLQHLHQSLDPHNSEIDINNDIEARNSTPTQNNPLALQKILHLHKRTKNQKKGSLKRLNQDKRYGTSKKDNCLNNNLQKRDDLSDFDAFTQADPVSNSFKMSSQTVSLSQQCPCSKNSPKNDSMLSTSTITQIPSKRMNNIPQAQVVSCDQNAGNGDFVTAELLEKTSQKSPFAKDLTLSCAKSRDLMTALSIPQSAGHSSRDMGANFFTPEAIRNSNAKPVPLVRVDPLYDVYICDINLCPTHCNDIVQVAEHCAQGQYSTYTYAKQTLGCRDFKELGLICETPVMTACATIRHHLYNKQKSLEKKNDIENLSTDQNPSNTKQKKSNRLNLRIFQDSSPKEDPMAEKELILDDREPHIVKYDVTKIERKKLDMHTDKSDWTFIIALSQGGGVDYDGGGTYFECFETTVHLQQGQALIFPGKLRHKGQKIHNGLRFLLVGFLVENPKEDNTGSD